MTTIALPLLHAPLYTPAIQGLLAQRLAPFPWSDGDVVAVGSTLNAQGEQVSFSDDLTLWLHRTQIDESGPWPKAGPEVRDFYDATTAQADTFAACAFQALGHPQLAVAARQAISAAGPFAEPALYQIACLPHGVLIFQEGPFDSLAQGLRRRGHTHLDAQAARALFLAVHHPSSQHTRLRFLAQANALLEAWVHKTCVADGERATPLFGGVSLAFQHR